MFTVCVILYLKTAAAINTFMDQYGMVDPWCFHSPNSRAFSFFSPVHHTFSRINFFILDFRLLPLSTPPIYHGIVISDHAPLSFELNFPDQPALYKTWCLNPLLLSEGAFVTFIQKQMRTFIETNASPEVSHSTI